MRFLVREADARISVIGLTMELSSAVSCEAVADLEPLGKQCAVIYGNAFGEPRGVVITK